MPAYPLRGQTVGLGGLPAGGLRLQAGGSGDATPQPGKRVPAPAPAVRWQVWPWGRKEERMEDADLPLKRRVALLGATLKARPGAGRWGVGSPGRVGWRAKMRGALQLSQCRMCPGQSRRSQTPRPVFSFAPGEVTRLSLLFNVGLGKE